MKDAFGNYVVQKIVEDNLTEAISTILIQIKGQILDLSLNIYSCRVLQKLLEIIPSAEVLELMIELKGHI